MAVNTAVYVYQMTHPPTTGYLPTPSDDDDNTWPMVVSIIVGIILGVAMYKLFP